MSEQKATIIPAPLPSINTKDEMSGLKKQTLFERKEQILSELVSIIMCDFEEANVTKDLQRMCQKTKLMIEETDNQWKEITFCKSGETNTATVLVDLFNTLVSFLTPKSKDGTSSVIRWLKLIEMEKYSENFTSCGIVDLNLIVKVGLNDKDFDELKISTLGDKKYLQYCLSCLNSSPIPFMYQYNPISLDEFGQFVVLQEPTTLRNFLSKRFGKFQPLLQVLNCYHQAIVVSFLGHLGEALFYTSGYRFKDIKGSWNIIISYHRGSVAPFVSVTHKRSEMVLATIDKKFQEVFAFQWELQCQFVSVDCHDISCFKAKLLGFDWSNSSKKDMPQEEKDILEKNIKNVFQDMEIFNSIPKKKDVKTILEAPSKVIKKPGLFASVTESEE